MYDFVVFVSVLADEVVEAEGGVRLRGRLARHAVGLFSYNDSVSLISFIAISLLLILI